MSIPADSPTDAPDAAGAASGGAGDNAAAGNGSCAQTPKDHLNAAAAAVDEAWDYARHYVAARVDAAKIKARDAGLRAAFVLVGLVMAAALVVTAVVLFCIGMAQGIGAMLGHTPWAGNIITGTLLLGAMALVVRLGINRVSGFFHRRTVMRYETRRNQQRARHYHDARERARRPQA